MRGLPHAGHLKAVFPRRASGTPHDMHLDDGSIGSPPSLYPLLLIEAFGEWASRWWAQGRGGRLRTAAGGCGRLRAATGGRGRSRPSG